LWLNRKVIGLNSKIIYNVGRYNNLVNDLLKMYNLLKITMQKLIKHFSVGNIFKQFHNTKSIISYYYLINFLPLIVTYRLYATSDIYNH